MKKTIEFMECMTLQSTLHLSLDQRKAINQAITILKRCQDVDGIEQKLEDEFGLVDGITREWKKELDEPVDTIWFKDVAHRISKMLTEER